MEKNGGYKVVAVIALVIGVVALAVGFAAYEANLTIENASANVNGSDLFSPNVNYVATSMSCQKTGTAAIKSAGTVNKTVWSGIEVDLAARGDSVVCTATVENKSAFIAYLNKITSTTTLSCAANDANGTPATQNIEEACAGITVTVASGGASAVITSTAAASNEAISSNTIAANTGTKDVTVTIAYASDAEVADGDFKVTIPQINLVYNTED